MGNRVLKVERGSHCIMKFEDKWVQTSSIKIFDGVKQFRNFHVGGKIRCKDSYDDSYTIGKYYTINKIKIEKNRRVPKDNKFITEPILGYFWINQDDGNPECHFIYESNKAQTRTYKKWFDEPIVPRKKK